MKKTVQRTSKFKVFWGMLALVFVLGAGLFSENLAIVSHAESAAKVTASSAKIRKSADSSSEVIGSAAKDKTISIKSQTKGADGYTWYEVYVDANTLGYIRSDLVNITDGSTPPSSSGTTTTTTTTNNAASVGASTAVSSSGFAISKFSDIKGHVDSKVYDAFVNLGFELKINSKLATTGVFSTKNHNIQLKRGQSSYLLHELGHFVSALKGRNGKKIDQSSEFTRIYNEEKSAYVGNNKAYVTQDAAEYFAESIGRMAYQALLEEVYTVPKPGLVDPYSCGAHTDMDVQTFERSAEALYPWFVRMAYQGYQLTCTPEDLFREIRKTGMLAEEAMYRATGHVNTHKGMIFTLGIFSAAAGRCIQEDGTVTLQSILRMEQKMTARILRAEIEMLGKEPAKSNGEKNLVQYGTTGIRGEALAGYPSVFHIALPVLEDGLLRGMEWNRIKLQILFALMSRVQDSNILSRKNPSVLYQVQMEAMQFLEEGGAYSEDALDKLIRMDADYIKRGISAGGCADLLATSLFLAMLCNKIPNENGAILNLFPVVK